MTAVVLTALPAAADAPDRLITRHGVELRADENVFVLFAALNSLGYAEETRRKGPPLKAPVFHPIREDVRDALRQAGKSAAGIQKMFDENPVEIEAYLEAILAGDKEKNLSKDAAKVKPKIGAIEKFRSDAELVALFDKIAEEQRTVTALLKKNLEADFDEAERIVGSRDVRAPLSLVVVVNPLDGHDIVRRVSVGDTTYLVVGAGLESAQKAILSASLRPVVARHLKDSWAANGKKFKAHWDSLKTSSRVGRFYKDDEAYFAAALSNAVAYQVRVGKSRNKDRDEDFIEEQNNEGIRWARAALKVSDDARGKWSAELGKAVAKATP